MYSQRSHKAPQTTAITNNQVEQLLAMREAQKGLKDRLKLMDEAIEKIESQLLGLIDRGADLSACGYAVSVQETERRYPAWKEHFISRLGKDEADAILEHTSPTIHRKLVVK